ncbi:MAG TPA: hypothetical protein VF988_04650, partial [Verrucomicrobiae bacterium]
VEDGSRDKILQTGEILMLLKLPEPPALRMVKRRERRAPMHLTQARRLSRFNAQTMKRIY